MAVSCPQRGKGKTLSGGLVKKMILCCALLLSVSSLSAQDTAVEESDTSTTDMASESRSSTWQNWVFASSALVTAVIGVVIISLNTGTTSN